MVYLSPILLFCRRPIKPSSLQLFLRFTLAVICPQDRPVELDLISQLATREFTSPMDLGLEQEEHAAPFLAPESEPSPGQHGTWRYLHQKPTVTGLNIKEAIIQLDDIFYQGLNTGHQGQEHGTDEVMMSKSPVSHRACQMLNPRINILSNDRQKTFEDEIVLSHTRTSHHIGQSDEGVNPASLSKPGNRSGESLVIVGEEPYKDSSSLASRKRNESPNHPQTATKKTKASSTVAYSSTQALQRLISIAHEAQTHSTKQNLIPAWGRACRRPRSRQTDGISLRKPHPSISPSNPSRAFKSSENAASLKGDQSQKDLETRYLESPVEYEATPTKLIARCDEYGRIRSHALRFLPKGRTVKWPAVHSACVRLGDLELEKLGLRIELDELCDTLKTKWMGTKASDGKERDGPQNYNKHRLYSIELSTKTSLYIMNLVNDNFAPSVFKSKTLLQESQRCAFEFLKKFWLALDLEGSTEAEKLMSRTIMHARDLRMKAVWLATALTFKESMPEVFRVVKCNGELKIKQDFKSFVIDKTLLAGWKIQVLTKMYPEWEAVFVLNVKFKLPRKDTRGFEIRGKEPDSYSLANHKREQFILGVNTITNQKENSNRYSTHHTVAQLKPEDSKSLHHTLSPKSHQQADISLFEDQIQGKSSDKEFLMDEDVPHESQQEYGQPTHISQSFPENDFMGGGNDLNVPLHGQLMQDYFNFRSEYIHFDRYLTDNRRKVYISSELDFLGKIMIAELGLQGDEKIFHNEMRHILYEVYEEGSCIGTRKQNENQKRLRVVTYATRAVLFFIKVINRIYSPRLYPSKKSRKYAQQDGFKLLKEFWKSLYLKPNYYRSDKLAILAFEQVHDICKTENWKCLQLSWISVLYWIREKLPHSFYREFSDMDSLSLKPKRLLGDFTLAEGYRLKFYDPQLEECAVRFERKFILRRPVSGE